MGGNCHILGHIGVCTCFCVKRTNQQCGADWEAAIAFKQGFVEYEIQLRTLQHEVSKEEGRVKIDIISEVNSREWAEAVEAGLMARKQAVGAMEKPDLQRQWERWVRYRQAIEEDSQMCRRFIGKMDGVIREEKSCLRKSCGRCWQWRRIDGEPFIPWDVQLRWIREFFEGVRYRVEWGERETKEVYLAGASKGGYKRVMPQSKLEGPAIEEEAVFGTAYSRFPTDRRPSSFHLEVDEVTETVVCEEWFQSMGIHIGQQLDPVERAKTIRLLYTWRTLFISDTRELPATDLVIHAIPTYANVKAHRAREVPVTPEEEAWQLRNLPPMLGVIIGFTQSPWSAKTTFVEKKDSADSRDPVTGFRTSLRMVHTYCALNDATIKSNYPMKRMEPIISGLAKGSRRFYFTGDATNGYYAVPLLAEHAYKTAFSTVLGQCCYLRMGMGLTGSPHTYARLKDLTFGPIPEPFAEQSVRARVREEYGDALDFCYFFDDDYGAADNFEDMYGFLHQYYFPRMAWAKLSLKPTKAHFMVDSINPLGLSIGNHQRNDGTWVRGVKASMRKLEKLRDFPVPSSLEELDKFLYLTLYLKMFIPGRAEHARVLKAKSKSPFEWTSAQQISFDAIKEAVVWNACEGNDPARRHYLAVDTSEYGFGGVSFQLGDVDEEQMLVSGSVQFPPGRERVIQYISQRFQDAETRYLPLEREVLAVVRSLEEVRWLAINSRYPVTVYTDKHAVLKVIRGDDVRSRIAGWQWRLSEYDLDVRHVPSKNLALATGLSRMPYTIMDEPNFQDTGWADVQQTQKWSEYLVSNERKEPNKIIKEGKRKGEPGRAGKIIKAVPDGARVREMERGGRSTEQCVRVAGQGVGKVEPVQEVAGNGRKLEYREGREGVDSQTIQIINKPVKLEPKTTIRAENNNKEGRGREGSVGRKLGGEEKRNGEDGKRIEEKKRRILIIDAIPDRNQECPGPCKKREEEDYSREGEDVREDESKGDESKSREIESAPEDESQGEEDKDILITKIKTKKRVIQNPVDDILYNRIFQCPVQDVTIIHDPGLGLIINEDNLLVYCDGACKGNGSDAATAAIGIYWGPDHCFNTSEVLPPDFIHTNQVAELFAVLKTLEMSLEIWQNPLVQNKGLVIASDSEYVCRGLTRWIPAWKRKQYKGVRNAVLFQKLDMNMDILWKRGIPVKLWKIPREMNMQADALSKAVIQGTLTHNDNAEVMMLNAEVQQLTSEWSQYLVDPSYREIVWYKIHGSLPAAKQNPKRERKVRQEAGRFVLVHDGHARLCRRESSGELAECIREGQVEAVLRQLHDCHGHFASGVMSRNVIGRFYWPARFKDIARWCNTCDACQRLGPLRPSANLVPVMQLQPMDMLGIDFIGPFNPISENGGKFIIVAVDYFSRYVWARVATSNHGYIVESFIQQDIVRRFGWPLSIYADNGSHFVKGILPGLLEQNGVKLFSAPITHPSSVGLAERHVQMVLAGLRAKVLADLRPNAKLIWHEHLPEILHSINTRVMLVHGYTPSQLFMGFNARMTAWDSTGLDDTMRQLMSHRVVGASPVNLLEPTQYHYRLAQLEEMRELARERVLLKQEAQENDCARSRHKPPQQGDLVLLRRFIVDKERGWKLEARWEGPYRLSKIAKEGVSGYLQDLTSGRIKGRYAFDAMKIYVPRGDKTKEAVVAFEEGLDCLCADWYEGREVDWNRWKG